MTPFGGQIIDGVGHDGKEMELSCNSTISSNSTITTSSDEIPYNNSYLQSSNLRITDTNSEIHDEIEIPDEIHDETAVDKGKAKKIVEVNVDINDDRSDTSGSDDAFVPDLNDEDLYYSTSESSYITDDDDRGHSSRAKRYREINTSESDDDMIHTNKIKHKKIKGRISSKRRQSLAVDDGDDQLYKMRIK